MESAASSSRCRRVLGVCAGVMFGAVALGGVPVAKPARVEPGLAIQTVSGGVARPFLCARDGGRAAVVFFLSVDCPIANRYAPELERIRADYAGRGVQITLIQVDPDLSDDAAAAHARKFGLGAPVAVDRRHAIVRAAGATVTPEAVVVDPEGRIRYRGRIDDQFADFGARRVEPGRRDLREALDALLAGRPVVVPEVPALGCFIPDLD